MKMELIRPIVVRFVVKIQRKERKTIMPRHGENIRKRGDGRWEGRYPVYSESKRKQIYRSVYGRSYREVKEKLTVRKSSSPSSGMSGMPQKEHFHIQPPRDSAHILLTDAAREWLEKVRETRKHSTYVKYMAVYTRYLEGAFQNITLHKLTNSFVADNLSHPVSDSTRKSVYCVLNQILKFASQKYSVSVPNLKVPAAGERRRPVQTLTRGEQTRLFSVLCSETDIFKTAILLCLYTGLRLGELCALKWSDIDCEHRLIKVSSTVQRLPAAEGSAKTVLLETAPKSEFSRREIPLSSAAMEMLARFEGRGEYVFGGSRPVEPRTMQNHFKRLVRELGMPDKNFHMLRHTFATNCIEGGTDVKSLSEILGHSDVQITLNRYVHPSMDTKRRHIDALSVFYGQIYGQVG